jgi:hypothetical protein
MLYLMECFLWDPVLGHRQTTTLSAIRPFTAFLTRLVTCYERIGTFDRYAITGISKTKVFKTAGYIGISLQEYPERGYR